jgi:hypothetical protein
MAATGDGNGRNEKRTGGARPPTIELTATEVPPAAAAGSPGPAETPVKKPAETSTGTPPAEATVSPPAATSKAGPAVKPDDKPSAGATPGHAGATASAAAAEATRPNMKPASDQKAADARVADAKAAPGAKPADGTTGATPQAKTGPEVKAAAAAQSAPGTGSGARGSGSTGSSAAVPPAAAPPRRGAGVGGLVAAALIGGVVGLGGALAVTHYGLVPLPPATDGSADELAARVDALAAAVAAAPASDPDAASALRDAVSNLSARVDALAAAAVPPTDETALSDRLSALEEKVAAAVPGEGSADAASLSASVAALGDRLDGLTGEVEKLAAAPAAAPGADPSAVAALEARVGTLDTQLGERIATVDRTAGEQLSALDDRLDGRLDALEQQLTSASETLAALDGAREEIAAAVASLGDRLGTLEETDPAEAARAPAAIGFATVRLGEAIDTGRPYAAELAALQPRLAASDDLSALAASAETGVPTRAQLAAMLALEKPAMLAATSPAPAAPAADAGPLDALLSGAQSLVQIRPTSAESGDPVATGVEAVATALGSGDLAAAETAFAALPEPVRAAAPRFGEALPRRIAAEAAFARLEAQVLARLNGGTE